MVGKLLQRTMVAEEPENTTQANAVEAFCHYVRRLDASCRPLAENLDLLPKTVRFSLISFRT